MRFQCEGFCCPDVRGDLFHHCRARTANTLLSWPPHSEGVADAWRDSARREPVVGLCGPLLVVTFDYMFWVFMVLESLWINEIAN